MRSSWTRWAGLGGGILATTLALVLLGASDWTWAGSTPATCKATRCFCEAARAGPIKQPSNTWSNMGFVLVGLLILTGLVGARREDDAGADAPPLTRPPARRVYGVLVAFLGWTSMYFHASLTLAGEWWDVLSMLLFTSFVVAVNLVRVTGASRRSLVAAYLLANAAFGWAMLETMKAGIVLFVGLSVAILATDALVRRRSPNGLGSAWLIASVVCCLASFGIWILDHQGVICSPESWFQGHAVWHVGQAGTTGLLYLHYASERTRGAMLPCTTERSMSSCA